MSIWESYAQNFWQLGNVLTGFAITEAMVVILLIGSTPHFENRLILHRYPAMGLTLVAHTTFGWLVWRCHSAEMSLLAHDQRSDVIFAAIRVLRLEELVGIGLFGLMLILIIWQAEGQLEFGPRQGEN